MDNKENDRNSNEISFSYIKNLDDSFKEEEETYKISLKNNYLIGIIKSRAIQGKILIDKGNFNESIKKLREAYECASKLEDINLIAEIINLLGLSNMIVENYEVALDYYLMGLTIIGDNSFVVKSKFYLNIGELYRRLGDFNLAMKYFDTLLNDNIKHTDKFTYELVLSNISQIMICRKQLKKVRDILDEGLAIVNEIGDTIGQAYISKITGNYYEQIDEFIKADKWYLNSIEIFRNLNEEFYIYETITDYCKMLLKLGKENKAIKLLEINYDKVRKENKIIQIQKISALLAKAYNDVGLLDLSNKYYKIYFASNEVNNKKKMDNRLKGIKSQQNLISILHEKKLLKIENEKLELEYKKLMGINDIVKEITSSQTVPEIVNSTYMFLYKTMIFYSFSIGLYDKDKDIIICNRCTEEKKDATQREMKINNKNSFLAWVIRNKQDLVLLENSDEEKRREYVKDKGKGSRTESGELLESIVYFILEFKGNIIGTMSIKSKRKKAFNKSEIEILQILKNFIAIALNNTHNKVMIKEENEIRKEIQNKLQIANEKLFNLSRTDILTNLKNRYSLHIELPVTIKNAKELGRCMTVNMIDLDYFKEFNDTNGHISGDMCLENIGNAFNEIAKRFGAQVYRYGGDEFIFTYILKETDNDKDLAEKIRLSVKEFKYCSIINHRKRYLTASVGVVNIKPNMNLNSKKILEYVDKALYEAKKRNRNTVTLHIIDKIS